METTVLARRGRAVKHSTQGCGMITVLFIISCLLGYLVMVALIIFEHKEHKRKVQQIINQIKARGSIRIRSNADGTFRVDKIPGSEQ